jgi:hypothetical protein
VIPCDHVIIHKNNPKKIEVIMYNLISHPNMNHIQRNRENKSNGTTHSIWKSKHKWESNIPRENDNWRNASINGIDSMSPETRVKNQLL